MFQGLVYGECVKRGLRRLQAGLTSRQESLHEFATQAPSTQQTLDLFAGKWITAFPDELRATAGWVNHFDPAVDTRVPWALGVIPGGVAGKSVLELGPFEAYHTAALEEAGAASVTAVEASRTAYLKCLVVKEVMDLRARFLYGDVLAYLAESADRFDIVWASGILYHQSDPLRFLELVASHTNCLFLHTHFFDESVIADSSIRARFNVAADVKTTWRERPIRLHRYEYETDTQQGTFAGGPRRYANWMEKSDIEFVLESLGFANITYGIVDYANPAGPGFFLVASS